MQIYRGMLEGMAPGMSRCARSTWTRTSWRGRWPTAGWLTPNARAAGASRLRLSWRPELFGVQLRALLRAARHGNLRSMLPFVSG